MSAQKVSTNVFRSLINYLKSDLATFFGKLFDDRKPISKVAFYHQETERAYAHVLSFLACNLLNKVLIKTKSMADKEYRVIVPISITAHENRINEEDTITSSAEMCSVFFVYENEDGDNKMGAVYILDIEDIKKLDVTHKEKNKKRTIEI